MSFRIGQCSSCGANYKLPASFQADQARCKNCGGVVKIAKAGADAPKPKAPAAKAPPVPAAKPAAAVSKPKREGPTMKERILAERQAAATEEKPAAKPAAKKARPAPVTPRPVAVSPKEAAAKMASGGGGSRRGGTRGSASRRGKDQAEGEGAGSSRRSRRQAPEKKGAPIGGILGIVGLLIVAGGAYFYLNQGEEPDIPEVNAGDGTEGVASNSTEDAGNTGTQEGNTLDDSTAGSEDEGTAEDSGSTEPDPEAEAAAALAAEKKAAAKAAAEAKANDPASVDLLAIDDFPAFEGTSEARFLELQELAATMMDPEAGAAGNRARNKLVKAGQEAMPVIINAMKTLDLTDDDQFRSADVSQKALQEICNGSNFDWWYPSQEPDKFHAFDKKVIKAWATHWQKVLDNPDYWIKLAKLDKLPDAEKDAAEEDALDDAMDF